ncbi:type II secretion system protein GspD [Thiomicrorhabdus indica]|uniref:type II secretion system protein GspD n=1 Tax=Thiomicrorhabdus indica TaxID=2267253 RepID=UPI0013EEBC5D|nr:hypothetical protein [Thiomicrorhabdus indica]
MVFNKRILIACLFGVAAISLNGCESTKKKAQDTIEKTKLEVNDIVARSNEMFEGQKYLSQKPLIAGSEVSLQNKSKPEALSKKISYSAQNRDFKGILADLTLQTGLYFNAQQALDDAKLLTTQDAVQEVPKATILFSGTLEGFLDQVAKEFDLSWEVGENHNSINFYRYKTQTYGLSIPAGSKPVMASMSLNPSGDSVSSGASVTISNDINVSPWRSVLNGVLAILGGRADPSNNNESNASMSVEGRKGFAVANPDLGSITITAKPHVHSAIQRYIDSVNRRFSRNILVDLKVINLSLKDGSSAALNINFESLINNANLQVLQSTLGSTASSGSGQLILSGMDKSYGFEAILKAIKTLGDVSLRIQGQVVAMNGQPAPYQNAEEVPYLRSISSNVIQDSGVILTPNIDSKTVGLTANFLPMILIDNRILLQYQLQMSNLIAMEDVSVGSETYQLPRISSQSMQQQAVLKDGQTIMLVGLDQSRASESSQNGIFGISRNYEESRDISIILLTIKTSNDRVV